MPDTVQGCQVRAHAAVPQNSAATDNMGGSTEFSSHWQRGWAHRVQL